MFASTHFKKLVKDSAQLWVGQVLSVLIGFLVMVMITRMLAPDGRGVYAWMVTLSGLAAQMGMLGMDFVLRRLAGENPKMAPTLAANALVVGVLGGVAFALVFGAAALLTPMGANHKLALALALVATPFIVVSSNFSSLLVALGRVKSSASIAVGSKIISAILLGGLIFWGGVTVPWVLAVFACAWAAAAALGWNGLKNLMPQKIWQQPCGHLQDSWKYIIAAYITSSLFFVMQKVDVLIVGLMLGEEAAGYYGVSAAMAQVMFIAPSVVSTALLAHLAALKTKQHQQRLLGQVCLCLGGVMAGGGVVVALLAPWLVETLFGASFLPAVPSLQILCAALVPLTLYILAQNALAATAKARSLLVAPIVGVVANISLNMFFIPYYGIVGAAMAAFVSYFIAAAAAGVMEIRNNRK